MVSPFGPLRGEDRDALTREGERLLGFLAAEQGADGFEVRFEGGDA